MILSHIKCFNIKRVPTDLESQGKPGKIKWSGKVREFFLFLLKKSGNVFFYADYREIKTNVVIFIGKVARLSFHAPAKTSHKIPKIVREICVQVGEKVRELPFRY